MKSIIHFIYFICGQFLLLACNNKSSYNKYSNDNLEHKINLIRVEQKLDKSIFILKSSIHNNGNDTAFFINMTCDYQDLYTTNLDSCKFLKNDACTNNFRNVIKVAPNSEYENTIVVRYNKNNSRHLTNIKIGFYLIDAKNLLNQDDLYKPIEITQKDKIIWSNNLQLKN